MKTTENQNITNRELVTTADGSQSISDGRTGETFHSTNGALTESQLVFINNGLEFYRTENSVAAIAILEIGFGTGLNAWLSLLKSIEWQQLIDYTALEAFPLDIALAEILNYVEKDFDQQKFMALHLSEWGKPVQLDEYFKLTKIQQDLRQFDAKTDRFDVIYFDAFSPNVQPELWTEEVFSRLFNSLKSGGVLVTYSARGVVKHALRSAGFTVKRLPGPPGKRHVIRALKL
ncbi:MAG: tRNA (5-methylaminomethyl-2-thiouridine)(34)-methyltransferase MnmD [Bacteroidales bacterium]|jgi:tRNA U34 5-methylaminomethyl-2-thiouridine-forming methyltransferase MnmC|nr:tRNA (5-methylaminomethyl-2-thiouridine)(34)-methyltransferase MnmD [Bacteroidales bacterium]